MRGRFTSRAKLLAGIILLSGWANAALAQTAPEAPPPLYDNRDEMGVDRVTGTFSTEITEGQIGGDNGIAMVRQYGAQTRDNWSGELTVSMVGNDEMATVSFGRVSEQFTKGPSGWVPVKANGATLVENVTGVEFTYRSASGTTINYSIPDALAGAAPGRSLTNVQCEANGNLTCAMPRRLTRPDGHISQLTWKEHDTCVDPPQPDPLPMTRECFLYYRLSDVRTSTSYSMKIKYEEDVLIGPSEAWRRPQSLRFFDLSQVWCEPTASNCDSTPGNWPTVTYSRPSTDVRLITSSENGTWRIDDSVAGQTRIRRPGATSDTTIVTRDPATGRVTQVIRDGETVNYSWTTTGGGTISTAISGGGEVNAVISGPGAEQPTAIVSGASPATTYAYDANGRLQRETSPEGNYVEYTRDARGNITATTVVPKPGSGLSTIVASANYSATCTNPLTCNSPNWRQDALGNRTEYTYDPNHGQVTRIRYPSAEADAPGTETGVRAEVNLSYTALYGTYINGQGIAQPATTPTYKLTLTTTCATAETCPGTANETRVVYEYNNPNLLVTKVTVAAGDGSLSASTAYTYDARDNLVSIDGPLAGSADTTTFIYDGLDRRRGTIAPDPDGAGPRLRVAQRLTFDAANRVTKTEVGTVTGTTAAALDAMVVSQTVDVVFDDKGNVTKQTVTGTAGPASVSQFGYDVDNRLTCAALRMNPATWTSLPADACAPGTAGTFGPDRITRRSYDSAGRVTKLETALSTAAVADEVRTAYTPNGQIDYVIDAESNRTSYIYDGFDRLRETRLPSPTAGANNSNTSDYELLTYDANSAVTERRLRDGTLIKFEYDDLGRLTKKDSPGTEPDTTYTYDFLGRLDTATRNGQTIDFGFDALGRLLTQTGPHGTITSGYDLAGRRITLGYPDGALTVNYEYDITGNVTFIRENGATSGFGVLATYAYDSLGRRQSVTFGNGSVQSFAYDPASRLETLTTDLGGAANPKDLVQTFQYNPAGQIASQTRTSPAGQGDPYAWTGSYNVNRGYAVNGLNQLISAGSTALGYDARGNLTTSGTSSYTYDSENRLTSGPNGASLSYDPFGRLFAASGNGTSQQYVWDGDELLVLYSMNNGVYRRFVYGPGVDEPIVFYRSDNTLSNGRRFLMADERGSIVSQAPNDGSTASFYSYDEFGIPNTAPPAHGYTGQLWLPALGMWYYKARVYSPTLGRFLQTDPIGYGDGMNWYNYVGSDPVNRSDPTGMWQYTCRESSVTVGDYPPAQVCGWKPEPGDNLFTGYYLNAYSAEGSIGIANGEFECSRVSQAQLAFLTTQANSSQHVAENLQVNPVYLLGLAAHESGWGRSTNYNERNNPFGATPRGDATAGLRYQSFDSAWRQWSNDWGDRVRLSTSVSQFTGGLLQDQRSSGGRGAYNPLIAPLGDPEWPKQMQASIGSVERRLLSLGGGCPVSQ